MTLIGCSKTIYRQQTTYLPWCALVGWRCLDEILSSNRGVFLSTRTPNSESCPSHHFYFLYDDLRVLCSPAVLRTTVTRVHHRVRVLNAKLPGCEYECPICAALANNEIIVVCARILKRSRTHTSDQNN